MAQLLGSARLSLVCPTVDNQTSRACVRKRRLPWHPRSKSPVHERSLIMKYNTTYEHFCQVPLYKSRSRDRRTVLILNCPLHQFIRSIGTHALSVRTDRRSMVSDLLLCPFPGK